MSWDLALDAAAAICFLFAGLLSLAAGVGVLRFGDGEAVLRLHARVRALDRFPLELEARRRVKEALAAHDIRLPRPVMDVRLGDGGGAADARKEPVA